MVCQCRIMGFWWIPPTRWTPPSARHLFAFIDGFAFAQVGTRSRGSAAWKPSQLIPVVAWLNIVAFSLDPHTLELFISDATLFRLPVTHFLSFSFFRMILFISCIQTCNRSIDLDELYKFAFGSVEIGPRLRLQIRQKPSSVGGATFRQFFSKFVAQVLAVNQTVIFCKKWERGRNLFKFIRKKLPDWHFRWNPRDNRIIRQSMETQTCYNSHYCHTVREFIRFV